MLKTAILQVADSGVDSYATPALAINRAYCATHGYDHIVVSKSHPDLHPSWTKVVASREFVSEYSRMLVLDADAVVNNFDITVESITEQYPDKPIIMGINDLNGGLYLNAGTFITLHVGGELDPVRMLLDSWLYRGMRHDSARWSFPWEQIVINEMYDEYESAGAYSGPIRAVPMRTINSWWLDYREPDSNQFIIHVMANSNEERAKFFWQQFHKRFNYGFNYEEIRAVSGADVA